MTSENKTIPPLPREEWEYLLEFDRKMRRETGHGLVDIEAINKITAYHLSRGSGDGIAPVPETPFFVNHTPEIKTGGADVDVKEILEALKEKEPKVEDAESEPSSE